MPRFLSFAFCLLLFVFCFLPRLLSAQSPWVRSKAGFYAQAAWQFIPAYDAIFDRDYPDDTRYLKREITENAVQFYGEYGITRKTTIWMAVPIRFMKSGAIVEGAQAPTLNAGLLNGLGNITLAVRQNFFSKKLTFSGQLRIDLPNSRHNGATGLSTGYDALTLLPTLSVGRGYGRWYWFAYAGWGARGAWENSFISAGTEGGVKLGKWWIVGFSDVWQSVSTGGYYPPPNTTLTGLYQPNPSYWSFGGKGIYAIDRFWGVLATAAGAFQGDLVPQQPAFSLGAYFKWD